MALFGMFPELRAQAAHDSRFAAAFAYVADILQPNSEAHRRLAELASGASHKVELTGGSFAIEQAYQSRSRREGFFESHRKYIDVQVIVAGAEIMEVDHISRLHVSMAYDADRDLLKYADTNSASLLRLGAGDAAIFFPADGHMPCLHPAAGPTLVRKTVVKVPVG